jgi:hypothetical protein
MTRLSTPLSAKPGKHRIAVDTADLQQTTNLEMAIVKQIKTFGRSISLYGSVVKMKRNLSFIKLKHLNI